jgi:nucleoside-diphosphate-sugar epimerase
VGLPFAAHRRTLLAVVERATNVLVTGATGFVGSHLIEALVHHGVRLRALVRRTSATEALDAVGCGVATTTFEAGDPALRAALQDVDVVFHLAAATYARDAAAYQRANVEVTAALVEAAAARSVAPRLVYLSSMAAAGPSQGMEPVRATDAPRPLTTYGRTKLAAEAVVLAAPELRPVVLRAPAVYGPRDRELLRFFRMAARGWVPVPAGPVRPLQLIHVADLVAALVLAGTARGAAGIYHVADPRPYAWEELARLVGDAVGRRPRFVRVPPAALRFAAALSEWGAGVAGRATIFNREKAEELLAPGWLCETEPAERELGFRARVPLAEGLAETAAWYRQHGWLGTPGTHRRPPGENEELESR